jgi:hypothetical protein
MIACVVCATCGTACEEKLITLALPRSAEGMAMIRNVPAEVCPGCGDTKFTLKTTTRMMAMLRRPDPPVDVAMIPIYDLTSAP